MLHKLQYDIVCHATVLQLGKLRHISLSLFTRPDPRTPMFYLSHHRPNSHPFTSSMSCTISWNISTLLLASERTTRRTSWASPLSSRPHTLTRAPHWSPQSWSLIMLNVLLAKRLSLRPSYGKLPTAMPRSILVRSGLSCTPFCLHACTYKTHVIRPIKGLHLALRW